jgi:5-methylcytosine-specific restriction endonuclease McrA
MARRPDLPCASCGKLLWRGRSSLPAGQATCRECRGHRPPLREVACGTSDGYFRGCRCAACSDAVREYMREYRAKRRAAGLGRPGRKVERACLACGESFQARADVVKAGKGNYCSNSCANIVCNPRRPRKSEFRKRAEKRAALAAAGTTGKGRVWVQGACLGCGERFPPSPGAGSRYCSRSCRYAARGSKGVWISPVARRALYLRDDWTCHICGEATSRRYDHADPWSPTLDHLVPRAHGGSDDPSNLATAHSWCNSVRGDLTYFTDGDLAEAV